VVALTNPLIWYTSRATGVAALLLLTGATVLGALTASRSGSTRWPRFAVSEVHQRVALTAVVFLAVHILSAVLDSFVNIPPVAAVVPFVSGYSPLWVGLGAVAFDLLLAVVVSSLLKARISAASWRAIHWLALVCWPVAVIHSIGIGPDTRFGWLQVVVAGCIISVLIAVGWRWWEWARRPQPGLPLPHAARVTPRGHRRLPAAATTRDRRPRGSLHPTQAGSRGPGDRR
jgi:sulfoxide reductase heme-binding subunit YedZ